MAARHTREALPGFPARIACRQISEVDSFPTASCFLSPQTEFSDMGLIEVSRGCAQALPVLRCGQCV